MGPERLESLFSPNCWLPCAHQLTTSELCMIQNYNVLGTDGRGNQGKPMLLSELFSQIESRGNCFPESPSRQRKSRRPQGIWAYFQQRKNQGAGPAMLNRFRNMVKRLELTEEERDVVHRIIDGNFNTVEMSPAQYAIWSMQNDVTQKAIVGQDSMKPSGSGQRFLSCRRTGTTNPLAPTPSI